MQNIVKEYKVAYWTNGNVLQSRMFDTLISAKEFVDSLSFDYLATVMQLQGNTNGDYTWKVLPISTGRLIPFSTSLYKHRYTFLVIGLLMYTGANKK